MKIFKQLNKKNYKHYYEGTVEELDSMDKDNQHLHSEIMQVIMWLYEKHGIWIVVNPHKGEDDLGKPFMEFDPEVWSFTNECIFHNTKLLYFNSPTEAYEAAIEYTLINLI